VQNGETVTRCVPSCDSCLGSVYPNQTENCYASGPNQCCAPAECRPLPWDDSQTRCILPGTVLDQGECLTPDNQGTTDCYASGPQACCTPNDCRPIVDNSGNTVTRCFAPGAVIPVGSQMNANCDIYFNVPAPEAPNWDTNNTAFTGGISTDVGNSLGCDSSSVSVVAVLDSNSGQSKGFKVMGGHHTILVTFQVDAAHTDVTLADRLNQQLGDESSPLLNGLYTRYADRNVQAHVRFTAANPSTNTPASSAASFSYGTVNCLLLSMLVVIIALLC